MLFPPREPFRPLPAVTVGDVVLLLALFVALGFVISTLMPSILDRMGPALAGKGIMMILLAHGLSFLLLFYLLILKRRRLTWAEVGLRPVNRSWYRLALAGGLLCVPVTALSRLVFEPLFDESFVNPQLDAVAPDGFSWTNLILMLALAGILAPLIEELMFRGLLYPLLRRSLRFFAAAMISALCFAMLHWIPPLIPAFTIIGFVLAAAREMSGSLWPPIIIHGLFNAINIISLYAALAMGQTG